MWTLIFSIFAAIINQPNFMKKSLLLSITLCLLSFNLFSQWDGTWPKANANATFSGGNGSISTPYILANLNDFLQFAVNCVGGSDGYSLNKYYSLTTDIDLNNNYWNPIGPAHDGGKFKGHFNGNGHKISNWYINAPEQDNQGLFGVLWQGSIRNVVVENVNITCKGVAGCITGKSESATIMNCYASGNITSAYLDNSAGNSIGGIVGSMTATGAYSTAYSYIVNCYASVNVKGYNFIGGLIGNCMNATVLNCQSVGTVNANSYAGGLSGTFNSSVMNNCFASGRVNCITSNCGGLIGSNYGTINNSYWDIQTSGQTKATGNEKSKSATGKTSAELKSSDFVSTLNTNKSTITGFPSDISITTWVQDNPSAQINWGYPIFVGQTIINTMGVNEHQKFITLNMFPNPATDVVHINAGQIKNNLPYFIYDCTGKQIITSEILKGDNSIDVSHLAKGLYLIKVGIENAQSRKLIIR
jgi:hypothetical protein